MKVILSTGFDKLMVANDCNNVVYLIRETSSN